MQQTTVEFFLAGKTSRKLMVASLMIWLGTLLLLPSAFAGGITTSADAEGPAQIAYAPANGPGPIVLVISGQTGPAHYQDYAEQLSQLGYYTVLIDGNDLINAQHTGAANFKKAIERAQQAPGALKGKAAVIGFSLGGGGALAHATPASDLVSMVVAYYPFTRTWANTMETFVAHFKVPVLVLAAQKDTHKSCCLIESMQAMEEAAKLRKLTFELVVYPEADHGFNLRKGGAGPYRANDAQDAWQRTIAMLQRYQPLKK